MSITSIICASASMEEDKKRLEVATIEMQMAFKSPDLTYLAPRLKAIQAPSQRTNRICWKKQRILEFMDYEEEERDRSSSPIRLGSNNQVKGKGKVVDQPEIAPPGDDNLPWVEKYRPKTLNDLVSHKVIISTIEKFIEEHRLPHLLFYGPPGTGKTSTILACAQKLYGPKWRSMIMEMNASDTRGIDTVREEIKTFASTRKIFSSGFKLIILDEADAMTQAAQNALRRIIEKYTQNVRFCIICNYISKIIPAIQSRCTRFRFSPLELDQVESRLNLIIEAENVNITSEGKHALMKLAGGDMRKALNVLQSCHAAYDQIDANAVYSCTGNPEPQNIKDIVEAMSGDEFTAAHSTIMKIKTEKGIALQDIITDIYKYLETYQLPANVRIYLLDNLASIDYRLAKGGTEKFQVSALLGTFKNALELARQN
ncbi:10295_t:CDS:10 [Ambispora gerdemannii]|uniref:Replication factor C subunit 3 n=1 Tax=Ambispora gerdemannii TaxID=144530 RepID=A0A9N8ZK74_9GLOM|nr:10295_t:CDS:10 [Ambispora gerdemannii]